MKVYVAAPYPAREYVETAAWAALHAEGHQCTSTWAKGTREITVGTVGASAASTQEEVVRHTQGDLYDIAKAGALIELTANFLHKVGAIPFGCEEAWLHTGGRHVEMGYALAIQQQRGSFRVITVGEPENVFQRGLSVVVPDLPSAIRALG